MIMPLTVNDPEFDQAVRKADGLVMVDVCATSCGGCRLIAPRIDQLAAENAGKAAIVKVTVDEYADPTIQYEVRHTPPVNVFAAVKRWTTSWPPLPFGQQAPRWAYRSHQLACVAAVGQSFPHRASLPHVSQKMIRPRLLGKQFNRRFPATRWTGIQQRMVS